MKTSARSRTAAVALATVLALASGTVASAANSTLTSYATARAVLDAAVEAAGGAELINGIETVTVEQSGTAWARNQSPKVDPPFEANPQSSRIILDLAGGRLVAENRGGFPGGVFANRTVFAGDDDKFVLNLRAKTVQRNEALDITNFDFYHRLLPPLMLRRAQQQAASLRWLGTVELDGRPQDLISFAWNNGLTPTVYIDSETHLVSKYELLFPDNLTGDAVSELRFPAHREVAGIQFPTGFVQTVGGTKATQIEYAKIEVNQPLDESSFEVPFGFRDIAPPPTGAPRVVELANDVYMIDGLANFGYNFYFVAFEDYLMAFDASVNRAVSAQAIALMKKEVPDKPVRYLVLSHHHDDHAGGIRAFVDEGATVVTTASYRAYLEQMSASVSTLGGGGPVTEGATPDFEFVEGSRVFKDATHEVAIYDIGPSPHSEEMFVMYLPGEKILFQADLLGIPRSGGAIPANDVSVQFAEAIAKLGLDVEILGGVHGAVGTMADLDEALSRRNASL